MDIFGKTAFFRTDLAGSGKYGTGGFGRIGVYRVNVSHDKSIRLGTKEQHI